MKTESHNMNFAKVFIKDIKRALYAERYRFIIAFFLITALVLIPTNIANAINEKSREYGNMNFWDYLFYMLSGMEYVMPEKRGSLQIPFQWMAMQFLSGFVTLDYIQKDEEGIGKAVLLRTRNKLNWWLSKCFCLVCMVVCVYTILYGICICLAGINYEVSGELHMELLKSVCKLDNIYRYSDGMKIYLLTVPLVIQIGITLLQAGISQYSSPVIGLVAVLSIDVLSVFSNSSVLWGNWGMLLRSRLCVSDGIFLWNGIIAGVLLGLTGIVAGAIRFCKKDIF
jgi:hypothetical protein